MEGSRAVSVHISGDYSISGAPNGGYLAQLALRTARDFVEQPDLLSLSAHYLRKARGDADAEFLVSLLAAGKTTATVSCTLVQDGRPASAYMLTFGDLSKQAGPSFLDVAEQAPELPPPEDDSLAEMFRPGLVFNRSRSGEGVAEVPMHKHLHLRVPRSCGFAQAAESGTPSPSNRAIYEGWCGFADGRELDLQACVWLLDAFPPSVMALLELSWVPTLELTAHCLARPQSGSRWLKLRYESKVCVNGLLESETTLWDAAGRLVAKARQIALMKVAPATGAARL